MNSAIQKIFLFLKLISQKAMYGNMRMNLGYFIITKENKNNYTCLNIDPEWISDIYFGVKCPDDFKSNVINAMRGKNVVFHQLVTDLNDIYELKDKIIEYHNNHNNILLRVLHGVNDFYNFIFQYRIKTK